MINKKTQGKKNRAAGARFELKVRKDLESKGWIVSKWMNNVEFETFNSEGKIDERKKVPLMELIPKVSPYGMHGEMMQEKIPVDKKYLFSVGRKGKLIPAKHKFRGSGIPMAIGNGFPDFIAFTYTNSNATWPIENPDKTFYLSGINAIIGVEVKSNGYLDPTEREKCKWLLENHKFSKILIASKGTKRGQIVYKEFNN